MSEHDLSTMLDDHLSAEPPIGVTSSEAIRRGRRGESRRRYALLGGGAAIAVLGVVAATLPGLVDGDGPSRAKDVPAATEAGLAVPGVLEGLAATEVAPYVGQLGAESWDISNIDGDAVDAAADDAQFFLLGYQPSPASIVQLHSGGFAPPEWEVYAFDQTCQTALAEKTAVSCDQETLEDGSLLISSVAPYSNVTNTTKRVLTVAEALAHPAGVLWARSSSISTRDGVVAGVSEFVAAPSPETADWKVPVEALRAIATDPDLLDPASVAHAPFPEVTTP